jgi:hypothetical protein
MRLWGVLLATLVSLSATLGYAAELPTDAVVLPGRMAAEMLHQCSRAAPTEVESTWQPGVDEVLALEALLPAALRAQAAKGDPNWSAAPSGWRRQYIGIVIKSRRLIYGNFIPKDLDPGSWRTSPQIVCDGGASFFGVVYDVADNRFTALAFNGSI